MIVFSCHVCRTSLSAEESQGAQLVRCPTCLTTLRVPAAAAPPPPTTPAAAMPDLVAAATTPQMGTTAAAAESAAAANFAAQPRTGLAAPAGRPGKRYGFNCGYCSSRLEATEAMAAQEGQCPTCGNNITIPILDRYGRLIDPKTRQIIKQDPHPVHAYAAAGERAPAILRSEDGKQLIRCPRCSGVSPISANNCKSCGMPFTMEGTTLEASGATNGFCVASLVLGIIGLPAACAVIPPVLAIIFGIIGYNQITRNGSERGGKGMAIAGIICGAIGCVLSVIWIANL